ncbi:MAG: PDZ domain-containing protein, partial [Gammaproteobacteria bacterium]|nr:PDZ domain-containing protein [Gammaproteobacteria bacterium]
QYRSSIAKLPNTREFLQTTYGDEAYDRYLYAAGRSNRLVVRDVYQGSAAEDVGLLPGDTVLSWDNRRVYSSRDLMTIATDGSSGESVLLTIQRDGARFEVYMPRGPLGITTRQDSVNPAGR